MKKFLILIVVSIFLIGTTNGLLISLVQPNQYPLESNSFQKITLIIQNDEGIEINDLKIGILTEFPFEEISGVDYEINVGKLGVNEKITQSFRIRTSENVKEGDYFLKTYSCKTKTSCSSKSIKSIGVQFSSGSKIETSYAFSKNALIPNDEVSLEIIVRNQGLGVSRDTYVEIQTSDSLNNKPFIFLGTTNKKYLGKIESESSKSASFNLLINPNIIPGVYNLPIILTNEDGDQDNGILNFLINNVADVSITSISTDPINLFEGDDYSLQVYIDNSGTGTTKKANLKIIGEDNVVTQYIGSISGNNDNVEIIPLIAKAGTYEFILTYEDDLGEKEIRENFILKTNQKPENFTFQIIIVVIVAIGCIYFYKKRKKSKKMLKI